MKKTNEPKRYFVGTVDNAPQTNIHVCGVCFPQYTEEVIYDEGRNATERNKRRGDIVELDDDKVKEIRKRAKEQKWFQPRGKNTKGEVRYIPRTVGSGNYSPGPNDTPVADYIYLVPMYGPVDRSVRGEHPKPISDEVTAKVKAASVEK